MKSSSIGSQFRALRIHDFRFSFPNRQGYRLDFYQPPNEPTIWNGSSATIVEDEDHVVWGTVWEIDLTHMASLDWFVSFFR